MASYRKAEYSCKNSKKKSKGRRKSQKGQPSKKMYY